MKLEREGKVGPALTLYGLRHTVAVILREIGMDERTIADALGQKTLEMARHYAKGADLKPKMRGVVRSFEDELNKRKTKSVKPRLSKLPASLVAGASGDEIVHRYRQHVAKNAKRLSGRGRNRVLKRTRRRRK